LESFEAIATLCYLSRTKHTFSKLSQNGYVLMASKINHIQCYPGKNKAGRSVGSINTYQSIM